MPKEYEALVAALKLTDYPCAEYGWKTRPEGTYFVAGLDYEAGNLAGDGVKTDRSWSGSLDAFFHLLEERDDVIETAEEILEEVFGDSWTMNSMQYETETGLFHIEWTFECMDEPEDPDEPVEKDIGEGS